MSENTPDSAMDASDMSSDMENLGHDSADSEPSMEDILASIRQIIADDQTESLDGEIDLGQDDELAFVADADIGAPVQEYNPNQEQTHDIDNVAIEELGEVQNADESLIDATEQSDVNDEADILELINFVDDNTQDAPLESGLDISNQENSNGQDSNDQDSNDQDSAFDESLDLVMDADASDYLTTKIAADVKPSSVQETNVPEITLPEIALPEIDLDAYIGEDDLAIPEIPKSNPIAELENSQASNASNDEDLDLVKSLLSDLMDEPQSDDNIEIESDEEFVDLAGEMDAIFDDADIEDAPPETGVEQDAEIDFVTGLVIDNTDVDAVFDEDMKIPSPDETPQSAETTALSETVEDGKPEIKRPTRQERDFITGDMIDVEITGAESGDEAPNILDEILYKSIEDEIAVQEELQEEAEVAQEVVQSETVAQAESVEDQSKNVESSELAAKPDESPTEEIVEVKPVPRQGTETLSTEISGADQNIQTVTVHEEDTVSLPKTDVSRKFSLSANTTRGVSALGLGAAAALMKDNRVDDTAKPSEPLVAEDQPVVEEIEIPTQTEQDLPLSNKETEKDKAMAQAAKIETILDTNTVEGSASAFASLTSAVQEKTRLNESGPAIGDLVQEALKPMLKEWLDKNLKGIVERAVTKEVKRISSGK